MPAPLTVSIIYNKSSVYGINDDISVINRLISRVRSTTGLSIDKPRLVDMREPLVHCDIQFHLEVPVYAAIPWAHTNVVLVNPEHWSYAYDAYLHAFDAVICRDVNTFDKFTAELLEKGISVDNIFCVPWCAAWESVPRKIVADKGTGFVCFLAGSKNKFDFLTNMLPYWKEDDPALTIYTTRSDFAEALGKMGLPNNVYTIMEDLSEDRRKELSNKYRGHIICSRGEGFGYSAANAEMVGAFSIMNHLPVFDYMYGAKDSTKDSTNDSNGVAWLSSMYTKNNKTRYDSADISPTTIRAELDAAFQSFRDCNLDEVNKVRREASVRRFDRTCEGFTDVFNIMKDLCAKRRPAKGIFRCPPVIQPEDCPPITIITPTYNRRNLTDLCFHNILSTDYPKDKIEWIIVEDHEDSTKMAGDIFMSFQIQVPEVKIKYIPLLEKVTIGAKRNLGVEHATSDIILFMDDDDHYPSTSFRRRVSWLLKGTKRGASEGAEIVCCTTLALYDLRTGISAVNVPPWDLPFSQRISEATLTFRKSAWVDRKFPEVSIAEGEEWISGREQKVIEIPPQQIIVAFSHGYNKSSRRIPPSDNPPGCFWGFPKEYLIFIHKLVGVDVVEDNSKR